MQGHDIVTYIVTVLLGGGLFKGIEALYRARTESREGRALSEAAGAKTPSEIESVSVATMATALESAQKRIASLESERELDRTYYQQRIQELDAQLTRMRAEMAQMETTVRKLTAETHL